MNTLKKGSAATTVMIIAAILLLVIATFTYYYSSDSGATRNIPQDQAPIASNNDDQPAPANLGNFTNTVWGMNFNVPNGYHVSSNHMGVTDPAKADQFMFRKESQSYQGVPVLDVSPADSPVGKTAQQIAQYAYDLNKNSNVTTNVVKTTYGGAEAYEFGLTSKYVSPSGGERVLDQVGGKVVFISGFQLLMTGADPGLEGILQSLKFVN